MRGKGRGKGKTQTRGQALNKGSTRSKANVQTKGKVQSKGSVQTYEDAEIKVTAATKGKAATKGRAASKGRASTRGRAASKGRASTRGKAQTRSAAATRGRKSQSAPQTRGKVQNKTAVQTRGKYPARGPELVRKCVLNRVKPNENKYQIVTKAPTKGKKGSAKEAEQKRSRMQKLRKMRAANYGTVFPRYLKVLAQLIQLVWYEDIDALQYELEMLLQELLKKVQVLETELKTYPNATFKRRKRKDHLFPHSGPLSGRPKKSLRKPVHSFLQPSQLKIRLLTHFEDEIPEPLDPFAEKFRDFVRKCCGDVSEDSIKNIESVMKWHDNDSYYQQPSPFDYKELPVPDQNEYEQEIQGKKVVINMRATVDGSWKTTGNGQEKLLDIDPDVMPMGPLAQRLVCSFIDDSLISPYGRLRNPAYRSYEAYAERLRLISQRGSCRLRVKPYAVSRYKPDFVRSLRYLSSHESRQELEDRIYRNLGRFGMLENYENENKIERQLKSLQKELKILAARNLATKQSSLKMVEELKIETDIRKRLREADTEVLKAVTYMIGVKRKRKRMFILEVKRKRKRMAKRQRNKIKQVISKRLVIRDELDIATGAYQVTNEVTDESTNDTSNDSDVPYFSYCDYMFWE